MFGMFGMFGTHRRLGFGVVVFAAVLVACGNSRRSDGASGGTSSSTGGTTSSSGGGAGRSNAAGGSAGIATASGGVAGGSAAGNGGAGAASLGGAGGTPGITIIQEDAPGFSAVDGVVLPRQGSTSITGYTGTGFADSEPGAGKAISWGIRAETAGTYQLVWRYAFGGLSTNLRDATLYVNGVAIQTVTFPYTNTWNDWTETAPISVALGAGPSFVQLVADDPSGLANIDYFEVIGEGITPDTPSFSLTVNQNDPAGGSVSYAPVQPFYRQGASVTLTATANAGYYFQSWSGGVTSAEATHAFTMQGNTTATALFLPIGTVQDPNLVGYAGVQDDQGTPYVVTGGSLGRSVTATTYDELKGYLESAEPLVVSFGDLYTGADAIHVASNKTLLGVGSGAHLMGIELMVNGSENVIIRNVAVSHVIADGTGIANDAIEITGGAQHVWIDHCELFADRDHGKDYYDGLLDVKNQSRFITVSWTEFHDHYKVSLISSGDEQVGDTVIRATYHHNYFHDCGSRLPSIRFGKAHVFDNYYLANDSSCVNSRMGAVVKVENNYFQTSQDTIGSWDSASVGTWDVANNVFDACTGAQPTTSTGSLAIPYPYTLDPPANVPALVTAGAGVGKL